ncbi:pilus assembly FimT family protein [Prochlorococcus marinus]|nr:type II secretion system protein [Prochlorococcus marinus]
MQLNNIQKISLLKRLIICKQLGYSINELMVVISIIGVLASIVIPNFRPAIEFIEVLIAEKHLLKAVKECQLGLINYDISPQYTLPVNEVNLGIFKNNKFTFSHTGIGGDCSPEFGGNQLRVSRIDINSENIIYSLIINVKTGEKSSEGSLPDWLDWWDGKSSNLIPDDDMLLD